MNKCGQVRLHARPQILLFQVHQKTLVCECHWKCAEKFSYNSLVGIRDYYDQFILHDQHVFLNQHIDHLLEIHHHKNYHLPMYNPEVQNGHQMTRVVVCRKWFCTVVGIRHVHLANLIDHWTKMLNMDEKKSFDDNRGL